jgi:uncharacterized protein YfdQ (DUF2303 family)
MADRTEAQDIAELAASKLVEVILDANGEKDYVISQNGEGIVSITDLDEMKAKGPRRLSGAVIVRDTASFIAYATRFQTPGTTVFDSVSKGELLAKLDYHQPTQASFCAHSVTLKLALDSEFAQWHRLTGKPMDQGTFAKFLEEHAEAIVEPMGAEVFEIVKRLRATMKVEWQGDARTNAGMALQYKETVEAKAGDRGDLAVPEEFNLGLPVYHGGAPYKIRCLLRYRIEEGKLRIGFDIYRLEALMEIAWGDIVSVVETGLSGVPVIHIP